MRANDACQKKLLVRERKKVERNSRVEIQRRGKRRALLLTGKWLWKAGAKGREEVASVRIGAECKDLTKEERRGRTHGTFPLPFTRTKITMAMLARSHPPKTRTRRLNARSNVAGR